MHQYTKYGSLYIKDTNKRTSKYFNALATVTSNGQTRGLHSSSISFVADFGKYLNKKIKQLKLYQIA